MRIEVERLDLKKPEHEHAIEFIGRNLRAEELYEIAAVGAKPDILRPGICGCVLLGGEVWLITSAGVPVFVWGVLPYLPGVYHLMGFGTNETRQAMPAITRWGLRKWLPDFLSRTNARRIEVRVPVSSVHSINWLKRMGMRPEAVLPNYSVIGEDFIQLAFSTKRDFKNVHADSDTTTASRSPCDPGASETECRHSIV